MNCRHCSTALSHVFLDLGSMPPSNAYLKAPQLNQPELRYPLKLYVCDRCWLVQTEDFVAADNLFDQDYAYFSSASETWLSHAKHYSTTITKKLGLSKNNLVIEIASNDGYLLKNFVAAGIPCLGIEPTASTAAASEKLGIPVLRQFFGSALASKLGAQGKQADLIIGNNVYAHVPDINDFTAGLKTLLTPGGTITLEFPHLMRLIEGRQFDTVYHEHFSYLSLAAACRIFARAGLKIYDVEELSTHGGSLRIYGCHAEDKRAENGSVAALLKTETAHGLENLSTYRNFQSTAGKIRDDFLAFLRHSKKQGKKIAAYGAAAKGNTLLNFAGVTPDLIPYVCDAAPSKQGTFLPGAHSEIVAASALHERKPDIVVILPWNIAEEVVKQHGYIKDWGGEFMTAVPAYWKVKKI